MYGTPGTHAYILPWGLLHDETDRGPLWDPMLNLYSYTYELPRKPFPEPSDNSSPHKSIILPSALPSDVTNLTNFLPTNLTTQASYAILRASTLTPKAPLDWFLFRGHWGDKIYPLSDPRQYRFAGQYHYVSGPTGPWAKNLARKHVCQSPGQCVIRHWASMGVGGVTVKTRWTWDEDGEDGEGWDAVNMPGLVGAPAIDGVS
jgi:hypothetical protein